MNEESMDETRLPREQPRQETGSVWTAEKVKEMLDLWGFFPELPPSEYERIAREHNAEPPPSIEMMRRIRDLAAKAEAMRNIPNEHERRLYEAIAATRRLSPDVPMPNGSGVSNPES